MKRTSRNYFLILLLFLIIALGVWTYFLFFVHRLDMSAQTLTTETAEAYARKDDLVATKRLAADIATSTQVLYGAFTSSADIATVVEAIEKEGVLHSVSAKVRSIATASSTNPGLLTVDMDIDASGSWGNLVAFSGGLERMPQALVLTKASFFTTGGAKGGWSLAAHITGFLSP